MTLPRGFSRSGESVVTVSGAAELLYGGLGALNIGTMCTTTDAPVFFPNGIPTNADGLVCITTSPVLPTYASGGLLFDSTNRLVVGLTAGVPSFATAGFLFDANGALIVSDAVPPVSSKILMEDSGALLLESGDYILMEA